MEVKSEMLSFLDLLDLDEEIVDKRLQTLMLKSDITNKNLKNAVHLLQYKLLINSQDNCDCENHEEFIFAAKLLSVLSEDNIDIICRIMNIVLCLNNETLLAKSEHLIQQILVNISTNFRKEICDVNYGNKVYFYLRVCDSILDTVYSKEMSLTLPFLDIPLQELMSFEDKIKIHFLVNTVPKLVAVVKGYGVLDKIWDFIKEIDDTEAALNVLSCLSNYYLPSLDNSGKLKFDSEIICELKFWAIIHKGLISDKDLIRKIAMYLCKRSVDYLFITNKNVHIQNDHFEFVWSNEKKSELKNLWDNFFILMESLEEKQSNIVLPSLQLFDKVKELGIDWLNSAYTIGLQHDNTQVKLKTIEYRLKEELRREEEVVMFLEAFNDINIGDYIHQLNKILLERLEDSHTLMTLLKAMPQIKWCPVPLYCLSNVLANVHTEINESDIAFVPVIINDILKIPCNNVIVRKAVEVNITYLIAKCFKSLKWEPLREIYSLLKLEHNKNKDNPFMIIIKSLRISDTDKGNIFNNIYTKNDLEFALIYLESNIEDISKFLAVIEVKIGHINNIVRRQYSNKKECLDDVKLFIYTYCYTKNTEVFKQVNELVKREVPVIIQYLTHLISSEEPVSIKDCQQICKELDTYLEDREDLKTSIIDLYKSCIVLLKSGQIKFSILSVMVVSKLTNIKFLNATYRNEMASMRTILEILNNMNLRDGVITDDNGRLNNILFEQCSEIVHKYVGNKHGQIDNSLIVNFIENVIDRGGYGCLKWILKIALMQLPILINNKDFDIVKFLNTAWKEIDELKSNNQYTPCMEAFIDLIVNEELINKSVYNNVILCYCYKIVDYGSLKNSPLFYLIKKLELISITIEHGQLIYILSEILLFSPIIRKDQRINENVELEILRNSSYNNFVNMSDTCFNYQLQFKTVSILAKLKDKEILKLIAKFIMNKIDLTLKNKQRYHGSSLVHRILQIGLQHLLTIVIIDSEAIDFKLILKWTLDLLVKTPHQPSVRICIEWFVALYIILKNLKLTDQLFEDLKLHNIPITSQFYIIYWVAKHKIQNGCIENHEFEFGMDKLLANTMGQMFNLRLNAQYLAYNLYNLNKENAGKYKCIIEVIEKTFIESSKDKNFTKIKGDFFANNFSLILHFTPCFIYYFLPRYCDQSNIENVDIHCIRNIFNEINSNISTNREDVLKSRISNDEVLCLQIKRNMNDTATEKDESSSTIQKKYIPWKNMSELDMFQDIKKKSSSSELVLVASLIDKLPNLGGMARTSEVFGLKTYVVDSLRHLQDKVFQGLSVSAERWVNIEEVRPGAPLKEYLMRMKAEGYSVVAAEQTSSSVKLQDFKFPRKSVLLLGHEKEGIPCDFLPLMDHCVEIPQQGFVRSLNVHVTAAIFVWEYTRQHLL